MRAMAWMLVLIACSVAVPALAAPSPHDRIVAQALFEDGRRLMEAGKAREACTKFEESNRLDPAMGTQFNLADCYEAIGRYTAAWILFVDVAASARADGQREREAAARARAAALEGKLTRLTITVEQPAAGLTVMRDGEIVPAPQWDTAVPIEPGKHRIEVQAPGRKSWGRELSIDRESASFSVVIPPLARAPIDPQPQEDEGLDVQRGAAIGMAVLAAGALAAGIAAGVVAIERKSEADPYCPQADACYERGLELRDDAREAASVSTVSFVIAASAAVGGLVLWLTAPPRNEGPSARLLVAPTGIGVVGRW